MPKTRFAIIFLVSVTLGLFLAVPMPDLPETAFDESDTPPYESTPLFSSVVFKPSTQPAYPTRPSGPLVRVAFTSACRRNRAAYCAWPAHPMSDPLIVFDHVLRC